MKRESGFGRNKAKTGECGASAVSREQSAREKRLAAEPSNKTACYTAPLAPMSLSFGRNLSCLIAVLIIVFLITVSAAEAQEAPNPFTSSATQLVNEVMSKAGSPGYVTLSVENKSTISAADVVVARKALEAQLRAVNARLVKPERAESEINITISENQQGLLWVAEIKQGLSTQLVMLQAEKPMQTAATRPPIVTVKRISLFTEEDGEPILDFALLGSDAPSLLVVNPEHLAIYSRTAGGWRASGSLPIAHSQPWPRDLRGHLTLQSSGLLLYLPGVQCTGNLTANGTLAELKCTDSDDPWPIAQTKGFFSANRNYFTGVISSSEQSLPAFYSAASMGDVNPVWIVTGTDGHARLYSSLNQQPRLFSGWGSDIASLRSSCGQRWQLLVSRPGDRSQADAVQALEIVNRDASPVSAPLELAGAITAMWPSPDEKNVNLITQDIHSRRYEASILTLDCGR